MSILKTIARPYAKAIFEFASVNNTFKKWKDMLILLNHIVTFHKIKNFLSGAVSAEYLSSAIIVICHDKIDIYGTNLIKLLARNQRLNVLKYILKIFIELELSYKKKVFVKVIIPYTLKQYQIIEISMILEKILSKKLHLVFKINPKILNGIIIKINDTILDLSIRNRLQQLSSILKS